MYKRGQKEIIMYAPREFGKLIGKCVKTLQRWDKAGILPAYRTPTNRRYYTQEQLDLYLAGRFDELQRKT